MIWGGGRCPNGVVISTCSLSDTNSGCGLPSRLRTSNDDQEATMGMFDSVKSKLSANKDKMKQGIDKGAGVVAGKSPKYADKINQGSKMAKDAVNKLPD